MTKTETAPLRLDALQALKLARTEGVKVRSEDGDEYSFDTFEEPRFYRSGSCGQPAHSILLSSIINPDGSPVIWEVVDEKEKP